MPITSSQGFTKFAEFEAASSIFLMIPRLFEIYHNQSQRNKSFSESVTSAFRLNSMGNTSQEVSKDPMSKARLYREYVKGNTYSSGSLEAFFIGGINKQISKSTSTKNEDGDEGRRPAEFPLMIGTKIEALIQAPRRDDNIGFVRSSAPKPTYVETIGNSFQKGYAAVSRLFRHHKGIFGYAALLNMVKVKAVVETHEYQLQIFTREITLFKIGKAGKNVIRFLKYVADNHEKSLGEVLKFSPDEMHMLFSIVTVKNRLQSLAMLQFKNSSADNSRFDLAASQTKIPSPSFNKSDLKESSPENLQPDSLPSARQLEKATITKKTSLKVKKKVQLGEDNQQMIKLNIVSVSQKESFSNHLQTNTRTVEQEEDVNLTFNLRNSYAKRKTELLTSKNPTMPEDNSVISYSEKDLQSALAEKSQGNLEDMMSLINKILNDSTDTVLAQAIKKTTTQLKDNLSSYLQELYEAGVSKKVIENCIDLIEESKVIKFKNYSPTSNPNSANSRFLKSYGTNGTMEIASSQIQSNLVLTMPQSDDGNTFVNLDEKGSQQLDEDLMDDKPLEFAENIVQQDAKSLFKESFLASGTRRSQKSNHFGTKIRDRVSTSHKRLKFRKWEYLMCALVPLLLGLIVMFYFLNAKSIQTAVDFQSKISLIASILRPTGFIYKEAVKFNIASNYNLNTQGNPFGRFQLLSHIMHYSRRYKAQIAGLTSFFSGKMADPYTFMSNGSQRT
jgi:hypothetical protein